MRSLLLCESRRAKTLNEKISKGKRNLVIKVWFPKLMFYFWCLSGAPQNFLYGNAWLLFIRSRSDTSFSVDSLEKYQNQSVNFVNLITFRCDKHPIKRYQKGKRNLVSKVWFQKLMFYFLIFVKNSTELPFWKCVNTLH